MVNVVEHEFYLLCYLGYVVVSRFGKKEERESNSKGEEANQHPCCRVNHKTKRHCQGCKRAEESGKKSDFFISKYSVLPICCC
jgi:hypothetical protein